MKTIFKISTALLLSWGLSSCETIIDYDLPREEPKLTIDAKLVVGDTPTVFIGTTKFPLDPGSPGNPLDATVKLYRNNQYIDDLILFDNIGNGGVRYLYKAQNTIIESNTTYRVEAALDGYKTAFGEQLIKEAVAIASVEFDSTRQELTFTFTDPPTQDDFYLITLTDHYARYWEYYSTNDISINFFDDYYVDDPFGGEEKYGQRGYMTDQYFNGQTKRVTLRLSDFYPAPGVNYRLYVQLWRITEDLYHHERTKAASSASSENPIAEPVQVFSNIENGYGIVGGAAKDVRQFYP